jgi:uncharacterized protein
MPNDSSEFIDALYGLAKAGNWTRVLAALAGEPELASACSRYIRPSSRWTFLHQAAYFGHEDAARALIRLGASTTSHSKDRKTPADVAEQRGHKELSRLLQSAALAANSSWEAPSDATLLPSSCAWSESVRRTAVREMRVAYAGSIVAIPPRATYYVDSFERILIGWHGTYDPPSGMDGEPMITVRPGAT